MPSLCSSSSLEATGQLPLFADNLFALDERHLANGEKSYLIPTAEVPLCNLFRDCVLDEEELPISLTAYSPCFRAEDTNYGKESRGLFRQHVFQKVELVKITTPETSVAQHKQMTQHVENILRLLELPYRRVLLCSGDTSFSSSMCYDLEVWMPGSQQYREISSSSNCGDFQARRLRLKYRRKLSCNSLARRSSKHRRKLALCHTLNASGVALGRTLIAILENYQYKLPDGKIGIEIPHQLRSYLVDLQRVEES